MARSHDHPSELLASPSVMELELPVQAAADAVTAPYPPGGHGIDPLSDVLRMVKLTGALFFLVDASCPWGVEVPNADTFAHIILPRAQHVVSYHIVLQGSGWASMAGVSPVRFEAGDILVFPHGDPYSMLSAPDQQPEFDVAATLQFFHDMAAGKLPFVIQEGAGGEPPTQFVCGYLGCDARPFNPVLSTLPRILHVKRPLAPERLLDRLIELTLVEARTRRIGGESVRLRLSELMFVEVVRQYLEALPVGQAGWLSGLRDPSIGRALAMLHERPAQPWTVEQLAEEVGVSRAVLAYRFAFLVGCPPMQYLARWRMQIAARLLADGATKIAAIGHEVGYESEAAFSRAFKKVAGVPPTTWRRGLLRFPKRN